MGEDRRILLDPADIEVGTERIAGLPILNSVLDRLGFDNLVAACLPEPDPRCQIEPAQTETRYPGTNLVLRYSVNQPPAAL